MRWLAHSLTLRLFLVLVVGLVGAVALTSLLAQRERAQVVEQYRDRAAAARLAAIVQMLSPLSPEARAAAAAALPARNWRVRFGEAELAPNAPPPSSGLAGLLAEAVGEAALVEEATLGRPDDCREDQETCPPVPRVSSARVVFPDGQSARLFHAETRARPPRGDHRPPFPHLVLFGIVLAAAAWLAVQLALRPLRRLAKAAENLGRDIEHPPLALDGPSEMRQAAEAFNAMQERIRAQVAERTQILAAISHDLKTPLTRMRLRLEPCADEALRDRLLDDLRTMNALIEEGLDLAQSLDAREPPRRLDLASLLHSLCDDAADAGQDVACEAEGRALVIGRPGALRRVFSNLIDNAVKYGGRARVGLEVGEGGVRAVVRDMGPGIPEEHLADVLKPFYRLETSRSRETGGTGLGLAIAANLLAAQQGRLTLRNLPEGGLEAAVDLPAAGASPCR